MKKVLLIKLTALTVCLLTSVISLAGPEGANVVGESSGELWVDGPPTCNRPRTRITPLQLSTIRAARSSYGTAPPLTPARKFFFESSLPTAVNLVLRFRSTLLLKKLRTLPVWP